MYFQDLNTTMSYQNFSSKISQKDLTLIKEYVCDALIDKYLDYFKPLTSKCARDIVTAFHPRV